MYTFVPGKPWLTVDGKYLLYDFVHIIKNIRNLWLTEKTQELIFDDNSNQDCKMDSFKAALQCRI